MQLNFYKSMPSLLMTCVALLSGATLQGQPLETSVWAPPTTVSGTLDFNIVTDARIAVSDNGTATAIFVENVFGTDMLRGSFFNGTTWSPTTNLSDPVVGNVLSAGSLVMDASGNAKAAWIILDPTNTIFTVQGAVLPAGTLNWIPTSNLSDPSTDVKSNIHLAGDGNGNVVAVWREGPPIGNKNILGARLDAGSLIWTPTTVVSPIGPNAFAPDLAMNSAGEAIVVWRSTVLGVSNLLSSSLAPGSVVWSAPILIAGPFTSPPATPKVAIDESGNAVAVWGLFDGVNSFIQSARHASGAPTWTVLDNIASAPGAALASIHFVGIAADGYAVAIWGKLTSPLTDVIQGAVLPPTAGFWTLTNDLTPNGNVARLFDLKVDAAGDAIALYDLNGVVESQVLIRGQLTWNHLLTVSDPSQSGLVLGLGLNRNGTLAGAVWLNEVLNVYQVSTLVNPFLPLPASDLTVRIVKRKFLLQSERIAILSFVASTDPSVLFYRIFEDGVLIGTVSASDSLVFETPLCARGPVVFSVVAVNAAGESTEIAFTVVR